MTRGGGTLKTTSHFYVQLIRFKGGDWLGTVVELEVQYCTLKYQDLFDFFLFDIAINDS